MPAWEQADLTAVLVAVRDGDPDAEGVLFARVHDELRRLARRQLRKEWHRPTLLETTGLVNEAWMRMSGGKTVDWKNRRYFFGSAARAMRRILVDLARRPRPERVTLATDAADDCGPRYDALMLHEALERLSEIRPRASQVVELRFFGGMSVPETAEQLGVSPRSIDSDWNFAKRWLARTLSERPPPADGSHAS